MPAFAGMTKKAHLARISKTAFSFGTLRLRENSGLVMSGCEEPDARRTEEAKKNRPFRSASGRRGAERMRWAGGTTGVLADKEYKKDIFARRIKNLVMPAKAGIPFPFLLVKIFRQITPNRIE
ncbi:MAG: hypothetical protein PHD48_01075 [Alphaproteobacteria bacterium]|nr:hypothetical protein [Alphaproteobacteria bacterium]